jgi:hypothetical protein
MAWISKDMISRDNDINTYRAEPLSTRALTLLRMLGLRITFTANAVSKELAKTNPDEAIEAANSHE